MQLLKENCINPEYGNKAFGMIILNVVTLMFGRVRAIKRLTPSHILNQFWHKYKVAVLTKERVWLLSWETKSCPKLEMLHTSLPSAHSKHITQVTLSTHHTEHTHDTRCITHISQNNCIHVHAHHAHTYLYTYMSQTVLSQLGHCKAIQTVYFLHLHQAHCLHVWPTLVCEDAIEAMQQYARMPSRVWQQARMALERWSGLRWTNTFKAVWVRCCQRRWL